MFKIKNWDKFQHYKHKNKMSWYKMYGGDILNDVTYMELSETERLFLREAWDLASQFNGVLPDMKSCAFRLRQDEEKLKKIYDSLNAKNWFYEVTEQDLKKESMLSVLKSEVVKGTAEHFEKWWESLPEKRKVNKKGCLEKWKSKKLDDISKKIISWTATMKKTREWLEGFNPSPEVIINQERWNDNPKSPTQIRGAL